VTRRLIPGDELIEFVCKENEPSSKHFVEVTDVHEAVCDQTKMKG